jgi:hypothetical protein
MLVQQGWQVCRFMGLSLDNIVDTFVAVDLNTPSVVRRVYRVCHSTARYCGRFLWGTDIARRACLGLSTFLVDY